MSEFTEVLSCARKKKKMLKSEVAELFGWTPMYYGRYENGYLIPREANYEKFAKFMGVSKQEIKEILDRDEKRKREKNLLIK